MALVNILNVNVLDNPSHFLNPFQFEITFECLQELQDDLEWKVVYVGDAENPTQDQVLEEVMVGPVAVGINRFVLQASSPNPLIIRNEDLIGVTVVLITCSYLDNRFVQIGYYVNNEYAEPFEPENYPKPVDINKLFRNLLADQPRVTRYPIDWSGNGGLPTSSEVFDSQTEAQFGAVDQHDVEMDMTQEMEEDDEDDDDDEEEGGNNNDEIDLEDEEEDDEEEDDEEEEEEEGESPSDLDMQMTEGMICVNDDSNSIDIDRMLQK